MTKIQCIEIQTLLSGTGLYHGKIDGIAGPMTTAAIRLFQRANGLKADGIAGPLTQAAMFPVKDEHSNDPPIFDLFYLGDARSLERSDVERTAEDIKIESRVFRAVIAVEAKGKAFDEKHRVVVLYEPHIAYRLADPIIRPKLVAAKLACLKWGGLPYPRSSNDRFAQIDRCTELASAELAASSASWGMGQIMGFNSQACGYLNAVAMVRAFAADAENQIAAMGAFIMNNASLHRALQRRDWALVAELYNGAAYRKNNYDAKLAAAYRTGG